MNGPLSVMFTLLGVSNPHKLKPNARELIRPIRHPI